MAEAFLRAEAGELVDVASAGSAPAGFVHPLALRVMEEVGLDLSGHRSKPLSEFLNQPVHTVITVCGHADQVCPMFPGQVRRCHWEFDDPAKATGAPEAVLAAFRRARDEIGKVFGAYAAGLHAGAERTPQRHSCPGKGSKTAV
jgi:arsenate reductase